MDFPKLMNGRWRLAESAYLGYIESKGVLIDVGPLPESPEDPQIDEAYDYLVGLHFDFLSLEETAWTIDLRKVGDHLPDLKGRLPTGTLSHPAAFETVTSAPFMVPIYHQGINPDHFYLRIYFEFPNPASDVPRLPHFSSEPSDPPAEVAGGEEAGLSEEAEPITSTGAESSFCYYSKLSPESCRQKWLPYVDQPTSSSIIQTPSRPADFTVSLNGSRFMLRKAVVENVPFAGSCSGFMRPDRNGGTLITGECEAVSTSALRSLVSFAGIPLGMAMGGGGWIVTQMYHQSGADSPLGTLLIVAGVVAFVGSFAWRGKDEGERMKALERDKPLLLAFLQTTLEAEVVEFEASRTEL